MLQSFEQLQFDLEFGYDKTFEYSTNRKRKISKDNKVKSQVRKSDAGRCECGYGGFKLSALRGGDLLRTCKKCKKQKIL